VRKAGAGFGVSAARCVCAGSLFAGRDTRGVAALLPSLTATRRYRIGNEITLLGLARTGGVSIRSVAEPYLAALATDAGDTVFLSVRHGTDSVCIGRYLGSHPIQVLSIQVGARRPLGASVSGITLLAGMAEAEALAVTRANEKRLEGVGRTVRSVLTEVATARRNGYVYAPRGVMSGTSAIAVPLMDPSGRVVAAVSIAMLAERLPRDRVRGLVEAMRANVEGVTGRLTQIENARTPVRR